MSNNAHATYGVDSFSGAEFSRSQASLPIVVVVVHQQSEAQSCFHSSPTPWDRFNEFCNKNRDFAQGLEDGKNWIGCR